MSTAKYTFESEVADGGDERTVTDPVTHLPITIHDASKVELEQIPPPPTDKQEREAAMHRNDAEVSDRRHSQMEALIHELTHNDWWEDPLGDQRRARVQTAIVASAAAGAGAFGGIILYWVFNTIVGRRHGSWGFIDYVAVVTGCTILTVCVGAASLALRLFQRPARSVPHFQGNDREDIRRIFEHDGKSDGPETVAWLNSFLKSLWPIINPALFVAVSDIVEDSLQANLPKFVSGVRVADIGQGSEPIRIVGVRWLDAGAAGREVDGMEAEEGDFINMEVSIAYRARQTTGKGLRSRQANAHVLMQFWLAGGIVLPVWVELQGLLTTARMRIQLTPNPPFLSVMTLTLLGKPKLSLECTPLAKNFLNVMDVPGLSSWIQSAIDATVTEYVAPRSINLDLKALLAGQPKMDTDAVGVVIVTIRRAYGLEVDRPKSLVKNPMGKGADMYVTVGWSKWGKPLWSTRVIPKEGEPVWEETTALLVRPSELNAEEGLRLQLWDSDRFTVDDLHGNVEVPLKDIISDPATLNRFAGREDGIMTDRGEPAEGKVIWELGYFEKTTLKQHLVKKHKDYNEVKADIERESEQKLREAMAAGEEKKSEVEQQKKEDLKEKGDEIISASAPTNDWPSGILSIRIEQISGLEVNKAGEVKEDAEEDDSDDLPSAYCTIIMNHQRLYKTRVKMKSNNPYFDAGTEKFIRNWRNTTVIIAVRDNRFHETDPLLGIVTLPLHEVLKHRSQWTGSLPITGGVGHGRMRLAVIFRSVQLHLPKRLLGWDVGTLEISSPVTTTGPVPADIASCSLVFRTKYSKGKMKVQHEEGWVERPGRPVRLAVKKRYASGLLLEFRKTAVGPDVTPAYCTLWLKDIPDDEEVSVSLPICRDENGSLARARSNASTEVKEDLGHVQLTLRFWSGLSGYHHATAQKDQNMADVMEVLDCAEGAEHISQDAFPQEDVEYSDSSSSSERSGSEDETADTTKPDELRVTKEPKGAFKDFRKAQGELGRKHRGLMQWRAARNVAWIGREVEGKVGKIGNRVLGQFKHRDREPPIEREA
ncbi:hypothetical protein EST38_g4280 [Candolleomyces aberdarensis]|uniref:Meiotically up-regulated gene 190 protein n=1 Tax=Candolleomyces aberdarensis TaxID=2316362 RepID=A0A4Q2DQ92_9AGAR|nr:hypothetical protein EST38_g4280 [Candolleomyces aberdarensis]